MWIKMKTPVFYYIDPTQQYIEETWVAEDHDGSTAAKADRVLPSVLQDGVCYLIRRGDRSNDASAKYCTPTSQVTMTGGNHVAIVGMPKADDELYAYMPEDAKTAWGADTHDKAVLGETNTWGNAHLINIQCKTTLIYNVLVKSVWRHRGNSSESENGVYGYFNITGEIVDLRKVENTILNSDLISGDACPAFWNSNNVDYYRVLSPFVLNVTVGANILDSVFQRTIPLWNDSFGCVHMVGSTPKNGFYIKNITIYNTSLRYFSGISNNYGRGVFVFPSDNERRNRYTVTMDTIHEYLFNTGNGATNITPHVQPILTGGGYNYIHINNITIEMNSEQFGRTNQSTFGDSIHIQVPCYGGGSVVENITCTLPQFRGDIKLIKFYEQNWVEDGKRFLPKSQWYILKNIIAKFCPVDSTPLANGGSTNSTIVDAYSDLQGSWNNSQSNIMTCRQLIVQNITVEAPLKTEGYALGLADAMIDMLSNNIQGRVAVKRSTGKIGSISFYGVSDILSDGGSNLLYIKKLNCNRNNPNTPYTGQPTMTPSWASHILIGETNTKFIADDYSDGQGSNNLDAMYVCTADTLKGNFCVRNSKCKVETWSVNRTGGHSCTLRFLNEYGDASNTPIVVGGRPFAGLKRHLVAGRHKLTFYMTTYGYNDPTLIKNNMQIFAKLGFNQMAGGGTWEQDDTTVWNNIELNTSFKYTMYIELAEEADVEFVYYWWWYMKGGYTYMDPFPDDEVLV